MQWQGRADISWGFLLTAMFPMSTHRPLGHDHVHERADHDHLEHAHVHAAASFGMAFAVGIGLNLTFVAVEFSYGVLANSVALMADAGHNLSDVLGLAIAWMASVLTRRAPSSRYTSGLGGSSILAALFNAMLLLVAVGAIAWEAVLRLFHPEPVASGTVMIVAAVGIVVNGVTAALFASGRKGDLNIRGAFLHMVADAAVSAGVVVAALIILYTGWLWLDPLASLVIVGVIVWGTWSLPRDSLAMSVDAVPASIDPQAVRNYLASCAGVVAVHDLHIWPLSTTESALTAHLVFPAAIPATNSWLWRRASCGSASASGTRPCRSKSARKPPATSRPIMWCDASSRRSDPGDGRSMRVISTKPICVKSNQRKQRTRSVPSPRSLRGEGGERRRREPGEGRGFASRAAPHPALAIARH